MGSPCTAALARAKTSVTAMLIDDQSFEVNMELPSIFSIDDVMDILANPDKLKVWCAPIQSMIITNGGDSDSNVENGREYEGEWIEGTTTALESPHDGIGWLYEVGQSILHSMGLASYGKITLFVERRRGQVGLTVGPFMGGIFAAHTIRVVEENGHVQVSDRVCLRQEEDSLFTSLFFCGALDSCLRSCLLPSLRSYMDQVTNSMAHLHILVADKS